MDLNVFFSKVVSLQILTQIFVVQVFRDKNTKIPVDDSYKHSKAALPDHVYMDAMGFGMGCCCLQLTFQACNIKEARTLYDQLTPLCPIMVRK